MENNLINIILNNGVAIGVIIYFIWKDKELTSQNNTLLAQVKNLLTLIEIKFQIDIDSAEEMEKENNEK